MEGTQRTEATPRKTAELEVDCATCDMAAPVTLTTKDVSEGGLFIKTEYPLDIGTRFGTRFDLGDAAPILAECEVAWVRTGPPEATPPPGMGVRFVALEPSDAARLKGWITGEAALAGEDAPKVTFRIEGLSQTVPGEFRASSDDGMSAVAELPFLKVGSAVQVTVDEPGVAGPRTGRIAWLVMEDYEEEGTGAPRVRIGIHFDPTAEAALAPMTGATAPIPLTRRKVVNQVPVTTALTMGVPEPSAAAGGAPATPWDLGIPATDRNQDRTAPTRRRVRGRFSKGSDTLGHLLETVKSHAAKNPRIALGVMALAVFLIIGLVSAIALSGGSSKAKPKAKPKATTAEVAPAPLPPAPPAVAAPTQPAPPAPGAAAAADPAGAPPLPGDGVNGRQVLASGPGAVADPDKVLGDKKPGAADGVLGDPQTESAAPAKIHEFTLGKKLVVKLPTKTKPSSVKHYLLANPDGVVVDAVGAAALLRPGKYKVKDPRVKHVRVLARGKDARFILYYGKGTKGPKMSLQTTDEGVTFVMTTAKAPAVAQAPAPRKGQKGKPAAVAAKGAKSPKGKLAAKGTKGAKGKLAAKGPKPGPKTARAGKAQPKAPSAMAARKLKGAPKKATGKRPPARPRPAPIADSEN